MKTMWDGFISQLFSAWGEKYARIVLLRWDIVSLVLLSRMWHSWIWIHNQCSNLIYGHYSSTGMDQIMPNTTPYIPRIGKVCTFINLLDLTLILAAKNFVVYVWKSLIVHIFSLWWGIPITQLWHSWTWCKAPKITIFHILDLILDYVTLGGGGVPKNVCGA